MSRMSELAARLDDARALINGPTADASLAIHQRCLVWLGGAPGEHLTTFRRVADRPSITILSNSGRVPLLVIDEEHVAQELWAALRLTFPSLGASLNTAPINDR